MRYRVTGAPKWASHCHCVDCRRAAGAAYVTYVGFQTAQVAWSGTPPVRYQSSPGVTRSFCGKCGTPLIYERARSRHMINIPRALFASRTGRQPLYHIGFEERPEWAYAQEPLVPLKGFPGVVWERPGRKKRLHKPMF